MRLGKKFITVFSLLTFLVIGVITALTMPDGTEKFTGVQKHTAEYMIDEAWAKASGLDYTRIMGAIKITAESVTEDPTQSTFCNAEFHDSSEEGTAAYRVTVGNRTLFGILLDTTSYRVCRAR